MALTAETPEPQNSQKTIFIVDDDPDILKCVSEILAGDNYDLQVYGSGAEALQHSKEYKGEIKLLLSDFQMPVMSGIELATEMTRGRPQLKVLLMSGFPQGMLVLNEGWHFLAKPFVTSQLRALVAGLADSDRPSRFSK
jgi:DNA-binding NtrC family response regulator